MLNLRASVLPVMSVLLSSLVLPAASEDSGDTKDPCDSARGVVVVPEIRKGISNQRMRWIQDVVAATLVGAAVVLPAHVQSRRACGFEKGCYQKYKRAQALWDVFDQGKTLAALAAAGVCVYVDTDR